MRRNYSQHLRDYLLALSLANLCFFKQWSELLVPFPSAPDPSPFQSAAYIAASAYPATYYALMLSVILLSFLWWIPVFFARRGHHPRAFHATQLVWLLPIVPILLRLKIDLYEQQMVFSYVYGIEKDVLGSTWFLISIAIVLIGCAWHWNRQCVRLWRFFLLIALPFVPVTFGQSVYRLVKMPWPSASIQHAQFEKEPARSRVVWFIFDKLDYRWLYEKPSRNSTTPALESLRQRALYATQAFPPGLDTNSSVPALYLGKPVSGPVHWSPTGELSVWIENAEPEPWDKQPNIFARLKSLGKQSAVAGWYVPHCRMVAKDVSDCHQLDPHHFSKSSYHASVANSLLSHWIDFKYLEFHSAQAQVDQFRELAKWADHIVSDPKIDLIFVHWPIPHEPWIYDSRAAKLTASPGHGLGYVDNIALMDYALSHVMERLKQSRLSDITSLIISSDHSTKLQFRRISDERVPFMVHLARQDASLEYSEPFNTVFTGELVEAILTGRIPNNEALVAWLKSKSAQSAAITRQVLGSRTHQ